MRGVTVPHARRKRPGAAAAAYSLALDILRHPEEAELVTIHALRRGAHSRVGVVAHARHEAVERAGDTVRTSPTELAASDARSVAQQLTGTRPAVERAVIALENRYGLDPSSFAKSLGLSNDRAADKVREIAALWSEQLDPAMMAWSGPGNCETLASLIADYGIQPRNYATTGTDGDAWVAVTAPLTQAHVHDLIDAAPVVLQHTKTCEACSERMRSLTPVRTLISQTPIESVPPRVVRAARGARRRLPVALPPSIDPRRFTPEQLKKIARASLLALTAIVIVVAVFQVFHRHTETQASRVARLVQSAPTSRLLATPTIMTPQSGTAALANNGDQVILWHATSNASWLTIIPTNGRLLPNQSISVAVKKTAIPTNSPSDAVITFTGSDGSIQTIQYDANS